MQKWDAYRGTKLLIFGICTLKRLFWDSDSQTTVSERAHLVLSQPTLNTIHEHRPPFLPETMADTRSRSLSSLPGAQIELKVNKTRRGTWHRSYLTLTCPTHVPPFPLRSIDEQEEAHAWQPSSRIPDTGLHTDATSPHSLLTCKHLPINNINNPTPIKLSVGNDGRFKSCWSSNPRQSQTPIWGRIDPTNASHGNGPRTPPRSVFLLILWLPAPVQGTHVVNQVSNLSKRFQIGRASCRERV